MSARCRNVVMVFWMLLCSGIMSLYAGADDPSAGGAPDGVSGGTVLTKDTTRQALNPASGARDSLSRPGADGAGALAPQKQAMTAEKKAEPLKLVKRTYGRKQVLLATVMMIFVVAIMTAAQQWNPG
jgi:hypothetical protein